MCESGKIKQIYCQRHNRHIRFIRNKSEPMNPIYTPGKIAKMIGVCPRTVQKWIDTGLLPGTVIPGTLHRRVRGADLEAFMRLHGLEAFIPKDTSHESKDRPRSALHSTGAGGGLHEASREGQAALGAQAEAACEVEGEAVRARRRQA